ncbi:MAG: SAM-dependent methyltransferase [Bacteroidota bacterium]|jgi:23S rRNA (cytosine1962-C5)-methyltransferase|nr:SAM-dependent methyltransferase [Bacteroidota bacterium]
MTEYPKITLQNGKELPVLRFHPWIFSGAIKTQDQGINDGDVVEIYSAKQQFLGMAQYQKGSITARIISFSKQSINVDFWVKKIEKAVDYRRFLGLAMNPHTNVYRLVFGEGDGCPGLIMDYYNGHVVFQAHSIGMHKCRTDITAALKRVYGADLKSVYDKSSETLPNNYSTGLNNEFLFGACNEELVVLENDVKFYIDFINGQKTGFFIDQRENRSLLGNYSKGKRVLNTFSYTGGFSMYAAKHGCEVIHSVDSSAKAIELCNKNAILNHATNHEGFALDTFDYLKDHGKNYDIIILDPPAFAKSRDVSHNAVIGYKRLNQMALQNIKKGGVLFTFSCSGVIDKKLFYNTVTAAAIESRRNLKLLHTLSQPADHVITPNFPEGEYLKGLAFYVD